MRDSTRHRIIRWLSELNDDTPSNLLSVGLDSCELFSHTGRHGDEHCIRERDKNDLVGEHLRTASESLAISKTVSEIRGSRDWETPKGASRGG